MELFEQYIDDVVNNRIVTSKYVRMAVQRHLDDLKNADARDLYFDRAQAIFVCNAFPTLFKHSAGELAGQPFHLMDWQAFIVACVFGWKRKATGLRRFRRVYIEVARRNGKSTLLAAIALFMLILDGEPAAQIYSAATKRDQAKIVWGEARRMVRANSELSRHIETFRESLAFQIDSTFQPLSSDSKSLDGLNIHGAVVDELHAHPTREVWDVLDTATGSRQQPLIWIITTAGFDQSGICFELRKLVTDLLTAAADPHATGAVPNDSWFGFVACIDDGDSYADESVWEKANPNLRHIATLLPDLREKALRASQSAGALNNFLIKHMCRWTSQEKSWLKVSDWDKCKAPFTYDEMRGRPCFAALDLAEKLDLTAASLCFPPEREGERYRYMWKFFLPEDTIEKYTQQGDMRWQHWLKNGELTATTGGTTDQNAVREQIKQWAADFDLRVCGFDPWHATRLADELRDDGIEMIEIRQNYNGMSEGAKTFEAQVVTGQMQHDAGQLLRWQADNVAIISDNDGNMRPMRPQKNSNKRKVDGIIAAVMACGISVRMPIDTAAEFTGFVFA